MLFVFLWDSFLDPLANIGSVSAVQERNLTNALDYILFYLFDY